MTYAYYPGCSLHSTASEYDASIKVIFKKLGLELHEVPEWICCGTTPAHSASKILSAALPIKNLSIVEKGNFTEVAVPCAACFQSLKSAVYETGRDEVLKEQVDKVIDYSYQGKVKIRHPLDILINDVGIDKIKTFIKKSLKGLKVVCYYGCLLTRPPKVVAFDNTEYPETMDEILKSCKTDVLDWSYKTDCCGASFALSRTDSVLKLTNLILENAKAIGADGIAVACPLCHANLDTRQDDIYKKYNAKYDLPVFYFSQLLGLAFGADIKELGLKKHIVDPLRLLQSKSLI